MVVSHSALYLLQTLEQQDGLHIRHPDSIRHTNRLRPARPIRELNLVPAEDVRQAHLNGGVGPEAPGAGLRAVPEVWVPGARRDKLVAVFGARLGALVQEAVGIVVCGGREEGVRVVDVVDVHAENRPGGKLGARGEL